MGQRSARPGDHHAVMKHLLVTNDFPPKIGGIQSVLWEWWRRLPADRFAVLTSPYRGARRFDAEQPFRVERTPEPVLLPHPLMVRRIDDLSSEIGAELVVLDPPSRSGSSAPRCGCRTTSSCTAPRWRSPAAYRAAARRSPACCGGPATSCRLASTPHARPSGRWAGHFPRRSCRPASTSTASSRSTKWPAERHGSTSGCRSTRRSSCRSPGSFRARGSTSPSRRRRRWHRRTRTSSSPSPAQGRDERRLRRLAEDSPRAGGVPRTRRQCQAPGALRMC